jgi:hypothetical protein
MEKREAILASAASELIRRLSRFVYDIRFKNLLGKQRATNRVRFTRDYCQERPSGPTGDSSAMLPMFQGPFAQTEQLGELALRKRDLLPDRLDIDVIWDVYLTAMVFLALGEGERLSGTLDHSLARSQFPLLHFDSLLDL